MKKNNSNEMVPGKVAVTGGAGFIGSHLAEELSRKGYHVLIIDDLSSGKKTNIDHLLTGRRVEFVQGSITELPLLQRLFQGIKYVFHVAAIPSVPRSIENPGNSHEVNTTGTLKVLIAARDNGVQRVIYSSSSSVYGDTPTLPKREDMLPSPQSPYAVSKLTGEYYCSVFNQVFSLPTASLRYFNVYGPRQDPKSQYAAVIPKFIDTVAHGKSPVIFGDGEQTRDFTFVKDVVAANILCAEKGLCGVYNMGRGERITIDKLARMIISLMGASMSPLYEKARPGDIVHSLADMSRIRSCGFAPAYSFEQGLRETIRSYSA